MFTIQRALQLCARKCPYANKMSKLVGGWWCKLQQKSEQVGINHWQNIHREIRFYAAIFADFNLIPGDYHFGQQILNVYVYSITIRERHKIWLIFFVLRRHQNSCHSLWQPSILYAKNNSYIFQWTVCAHSQCHKNNNNRQK